MGPHLRGPDWNRPPESCFKCSNCKADFIVFVRFTSKEQSLGEIEKVGQYPKLQVTIPKDFQKALGPRVDLYRKGVTARHNNYGIGALTYFRRLVEDTTDEMLDLLEQAMKDMGADAELLKRLTQAKAGTRFEEKVKLAAEVIPPALRPGGVNPFGDLYGLLSVGLHELTDEECCDIVDDMDRALKFIYTHLKAHTADTKAYEAAARGLHEKVQRLKTLKRGDEAVGPP